MAERKQKNEKIIFSSTENSITINHARIDAVYTYTGIRRKTNKKINKYRSVDQNSSDDGYNKSLSDNPNDSRSVARKKSTRTLQRRRVNHF